MPKSRRPKPLYHRGGFRLDPPRSGRTTFEITWYDVASGRERTVSAGASEIEEAKAALDRKYLEITQGRDVCHACGRPFEPTEERSKLVTAAIELYLHNAEEKTSYPAIAARLDHVVNFIGTLDSPAVYCRDIDERWIRRFRAWAAEQPIVSSSGRVLERARTPSTIENSVLQLAAAITHNGERPHFKPIPPKEVNRTPRYRADVAKLAQMFRYCLAPAGPAIRSEKERARRIRERVALLSFLRGSVITLGRPDAVHDISTDPARGQWDSEHGVLDLNPKGRRQTKKRRATVPIAKQAVWMLDECDGYLIKAGSVKSSFTAMAQEINLPAAGESGMKLIRRSVANIVRGKLRELDKSEDELEVFLGHRVIDSVSELYAPFDPSYLRNVKAILEGLIHEIEALAPGSFYRDFTAQGGNVTSIARGKNG
jgi:hypothetical protein